MLNFLIIFCIFAPFSVTGTNEQSGYGLELTFRLKRQPGEINPPMWPASLMNSLARYVFQTGMCDVFTLSFTVSNGL